MKESIIKNKSFHFALQIVDLYRKLNVNKEYLLLKQLLRSSTSIGANINEALAAESKADFAHKMSIANKEARVTIYWLELLEKSQIIDFDYTSYIQECSEITKILTSIVKSAKTK